MMEIKSSVCRYLDGQLGLLLIYWAMGRKEVMQAAAASSKPKNAFVLE